MRRSLTLLAAIAGLSLAFGAAIVQARAGTTKVQLHHTSRGNILADSRGFTLYAFSRDSRNHDSCMHIRGCSSIWPVLKATGKVVAGHGVKASMLGTISLGKGVRQVTYAGHPLYHYAGDGGPGGTEYIGASQSGGRWFALNGSGGLVK